MTNHFLGFRHQFIIHISSGTLRLCSSWMAEDFRHWMTKIKPLNACWSVDIFVFISSWHFDGFNFNQCLESISVSYEYIINGYTLDERHIFILSILYFYLYCINNKSKAYFLLALYLINKIYGMFESSLSSRVKVLWWNLKVCYLFPELWTKRTSAILNIEVDIV